MSLERWRRHFEFQDYQVSDRGQVSRNGKILKASDSRGYARYGLYLHKKEISIAGHKLIADMFCTGWFPGLQVNHKNGIKHDNRASNLEWVTLAENRRHAYATGLQNAKHRRGEKSNFAKLTAAKVLKISKELVGCRKMGDQAKLAKKYRVSPALICMIKKGRVWKHILGG